MIPTLHKPSDSQFLTQDSWGNMKDKFYTAEVSFQVVSNNRVGVYLKQNCLHLFSALLLHKMSYFKGLTLILQIHSAKFEIGDGRKFSFSLLKMHFRPE